MEKSFELSAKESRLILSLSLPCAFLIIITGIAGIFIPGTYFKETTNWTLQSMGQDLINVILIVPVIIIAVILTFKRNKIGFIIWGGVNLYLVYTFLIYSFDIHFNRLFLLYCIILGLSFYSFVYFLYVSISKRIMERAIDKMTTHFVAGYFLVISGMFFLLWLSEIVPFAILHTIPPELAESGLVTNPVHVLDLALFLPAIFITSLLLSAKKALGFLLAPVILVFSVLMSFTIFFLIFLMRSGGVQVNYSVNAVMGLLTVMGTILLWQYFKKPTG